MYLSDNAVIEYFTLLAKRVHVDYLDLEFFAEKTVQIEKKKFLEEVKTVINTINSPDNSSLTPQLIDNLFLPIRSFETEKEKFLEDVKIVIDAINSPDNFLLTPLLIDNLFLPIRSFEHYVFGSLTTFHEQSLDQAGLIKGIDYVIISYELDTLAYLDYNSEYFKECTSQKFESLFSFNGLKKLVYFMHVKTTLVTDSSYVIRTLDFEKVYFKVKELHAKNRKTYLKTVAKANKKSKLMKFMRSMF